MSRSPASRAGRCLARPSRRRWSADALKRFAPGALALITLGSALCLAGAAASKPAGNHGGSDADVFWKRADFAAQAPGSIALLPAFSFDSHAEREREVGVAWAANFGHNGYRWLSATTSRALLSSAESGDSLLRLARASVLKNSRVDSLLAPALCARMRVRSVLSVRIDNWDTQAIEPDQTGKPWSRTYLKAALVDSLGRLLWTAAGGETVEGLYQEAQSHASGVEATALRNEFSAGAGTPPVALDVFTRVFQRWATALPDRTAPSSP